MLPTVTVQTIVGGLFKVRAQALIHDVLHNTEEDMDKAAWYVLPFTQPNTWLAGSSVCFLSSQCRSGLQPDVV